MVERGVHRLLVERSGQGDDDRLEVLHLEHLVIVGVGGNAPRTAHGLACLFTAVGDCHKFGFGFLGEHPDMVPPHAAEADDGYPNWFLPEPKQIVEFHVPLLAQRRRA